MWESVVLAAIIVVGFFVTGNIVLRKMFYPSTMSLLRAQGIKNILNFKVIHSYIYMRWTKQYVSLLRYYILPKVGSEVRRKGVEGYHGKVVTYEQVRSVILLDHPIQLRVNEQILPYSSARNVILTASPDIVAYECPCRHSRRNHCSPTQVCMIIGKPFTDFMLEHHPTITRSLTQGKALDLLAQEHELGHMHSAWFRDINLNRFYAICNCCKCCCTGIEVMKTYGISSLIPSGYIAVINSTDCIACGKCLVSCPFGAIIQNQITIVQWDKCMGCGVCVHLCPTSAITLMREERKGIPFDIHMLKTQNHLSEVKERPSKRDNCQS